MKTERGSGYQGDEVDRTGNLWEAACQMGTWRPRAGERGRLADGGVRRAELHWYEAQGVGKRKIEVTRFLE